MLKMLWRKFVTGHPQEVQLQRSKFNRRGASSSTTMEVLLLQVAGSGKWNLAEAKCRH